jgi:sulfofructose kinase
VIVCCGYLNLDLSVRVPALPSDGARVQATAVVRQPGGMAANVAAAAARFGGEVAFVGAVGADPDGRWLAEQLVASGVDVTDLAQDRLTTVCLVLVAPDGQRAIISQDDAVVAADIDKAFQRASYDGGLLYLDGYRWPLAATRIPPVSRSRPSIVTDLDGCETVDGLEAAVRTVDHALCSRSHFAELVGTSDPEADARELADRWNTTLVLTSGAQGWWAVTRHDEFEEPAHDVVVVDTTGAGDAFCGAYIVEIQQGRDPVDAARVANAAAAISTTAVGARAGLADRQQAVELLERTSRDHRLPTHRRRERP